MGSWVRGRTVAAVHCCAPSDCSKASDSEESPTILPTERSSKASEVSQASHLPGQRRTLGLNFVVVSFSTKASPVAPVTSVLRAALLYQPADLQVSFASHLSTKASGFSRVGNTARPAGRPPSVLSFLSVFPQRPRSPVAPRIPPVLLCPSMIGRPATVPRFSFFHEGVPFGFSNSGSTATPGGRPPSVPPFPFFHKGLPRSFSNIDTTLSSVR